MKQRHPQPKLHSISNKNLYNPQLTLFIDKFASDQLANPDARLSFGLPLVLTKCHSTNGFFSFPPFGIIFFSLPSIISLIQPAMDRIFGYIISIGGRITDSLGTGLPPWHPQVLRHRCRRTITDTDTALQTRLEIHGNLLCGNVSSWNCTQLVCG